MYAEDAGEREAKLADEAGELGKVGTAFPVIERRLLKWQAHVERHHAADQRQATA